MFIELTTQNIKMQKDPSNPHKEVEEEKLPYLKEDSPLPKDYEETIERLSAKLENEASPPQQTTLLIIACTLVAVLGFTQLAEWAAYPDWMVVVLKILVFAEATIPFAVSFFLNNTKYATLLRIVGIILMLLYLYNLFYAGLWGGI